MSELPPDGAPPDAPLAAALPEVEQKAPGAAALMSLAAFFAPNAIPLELFEQEATLYPDDLAPAAADGTHLAAMLDALAERSLIELQPENRTFSVPPPIQGAQRDTLGPESAAWIGRAIDIIAAAFPEPGPDTAERCDRLVAHVQALNAHVPAEVAARNWAWLLGAAGFFLRARGALADALPLLEASRAIFARLAAASPDKTGMQRNLAVSEQRVGDVLEAQGRRRDALAAYQAALAVFERVAAASPGNTGAQRDVAVSHERVGDVLQAERNRRAALAAYQAARAIFERLAAADPGNAETQLDLAGAHEKIGDALQSQRNRRDAFAAYQAALGIRQSRPPSEPIDAGAQRDLSALQIKIGDALLARGDTSAALTAFQSAMAIREQLVASDPANAGWQRALAHSHGRIGLAFIRQGERRPAVKAFRKGSDILGDLLSKAQGKSSLPGEIAWFNNQITFASFRSYGGMLRRLGTNLLRAAQPQPK